MYYSKESFDVIMLIFGDYGFYQIVVLVATAICWLLAIFCRKNPTNRIGKIGQPLPSAIAVILPIVLAVAFAGLRKNVGDTFYYVHSYNGLPDSGNEVSLKLFIESSYTFWQNFFKNLTDDWQYLLMFSAIVSLPVPLIILYEYSYPFDLAIVLFVFYGYLGGMMNGMRQYMAAAIVLCGTRFLFRVGGNRIANFIKYAAIILLAYCMHNSAIVMLAIYFVVRRRAWQPSSLILILGSVFVTAIFDKLMPSFLHTLESTDYASYSSNGWFDSTGGSSVLRALVCLMPILLAYFNRERMMMFGHIGDILINLAFINLALNIIAIYNWIFVRVSIYLMIYFIIFVCFVVYNTGESDKRTLYYVLCLFAFFLFFRNQSYQIDEYQSNYIFPYKMLFAPR